MNNGYVNIDCYVPDWRAENLYTHPFVEGVALKAIGSRAHGEKIAGCMFFNEDGEMAFGFYGMSWKNFKARGGYTYYQLPYEARTQVDSVVLAHPGSKFGRNNSIVSGWDGTWIRDVTHNRRTTCMLPSFAPVTQQLTGRVVVDDDGVTFEVDRQETITVDVDSKDDEGNNIIVQEERTVTITDRFYGMEIFCYNIDDGDFLVNYKYGGWLAGRPHQPQPYKYANVPIGKLYKDINIGQRGKGIQSAYGFMIDGMGKDELKYFNGAFNTYMSSPAAKSPAMGVIVTQFHYDRERMLASNVTGLPGPSVYPIPTSRGAFSSIKDNTSSLPNRSYDLFGVNILTGVDPFPPTVSGVLYHVVHECGDPNDSRIVSDVRTGSLMAAAIDWDLGVVETLASSSTSIDMAIGVIGTQFESGIAENPAVRESFPTDVDTDGLSQEQIDAGWGAVTNIGPSKENVARICSMKSGMRMFPQLQADASGIYSRAISNAKKDAKKKKRLF